MKPVASTLDVTVAENNGTKSRAFLTLRNWFPAALCSTLYERSGILEQVWLLDLLVDELSDHNTMVSRIRVYHVTQANHRLIRGCPPQGRNLIEATTSLVESWLYQSTFDKLYRILGVSPLPGT